MGGSLRRGKEQVCGAVKSDREGGGGGVLEQ